VKRAIRAIEIEVYYAGRSPEEVTFPSINPLIVAISYGRDERRKRISERLKSRLRAGMIGEVESLLESGVTEDILVYYGLEYKYITLYLRGNLGYDEMFRGLETAIHQFSKRQMTWFRGMERRGITINWIDGNMEPDDKVAAIIELYNRQ
jgi:tRNA dimethylallyltransferase